MTTPTWTRGLERLQKGKRWKETHPEWGEIYIDRLLPFLTVYRDSPRRPDPGMQRIVRGQPAYLITSRSRDADAPGYRLIRDMTEYLLTEFNRVLLLELWTDDRLRAGETADDPLTYQVRIHMPPEYQTERMSRRFYHDLSRIRLHDAPIRVAYARRDQKTGPRRLPDLVDSPTSGGTQVITIGLALSPAFRDSDGTTIRPLVLRRLRQQLTYVVQRLHYHFTLTYTDLNPAHHFSLGRRAFSTVARSVDNRLWTVARAFDLIMAATPVNTDFAWRTFRSDNYEKPPRFLYRPIEVDPDALKRHLWNIPIAQVDDPTMEQLFQDKRDELDIQLSMLLERNTSRFLYNSLRLYGPVTPALEAEAHAILHHTAVRRVSKGVRTKHLSAAQFAARAEEEMATYRRVLDDASVGGDRGERNDEGRSDTDRQEMPRAAVRSGISGLLTVRETLFVSSSYRISAARADALIQHEVGTHILTYLNGLQQPIRLLSAGLDGYEALQEGIAVLAEFFSGGLDPARLRLLSARVLAAASVQQGADFVETYRMLTAMEGLAAKSAFLVAMRVHRAGGFVKDFIYLQGLVEILEYYREGKDADLLWTGKVGLKHIRLLEELRYRKILSQPRIIPSYVHASDYTERRRALSRGMNVAGLVAYASGND